MKSFHLFTAAVLVAGASVINAADLDRQRMATLPGQNGDYIPTEELLKSQIEFENDRFGIFIHWGIYSMFGNGEWYLETSGMQEKEYQKAASAFYPANFDAERWVKAFKEAGAKYITITSRHHDGFSMFKSDATDYNIVDATPFHRDVLKELADACAKEGIKLHFYYSHVDWHRPDYPIGGTGHKNGRDTAHYNWPSYYRFMNDQLTELLTNYGPIRNIWFDGIWDHRKDSVPFDWQLDEQYKLIHTLQPGCLVTNNHHLAVKPGEDVQTFERDVPGENKGGFSADTPVCAYPLETSYTMNNSWGYNAFDHNYKSVPELIQTLVKCAGKGANFLLNVGPQPNGEIPAEALARLKEMGKWLDRYGETIYGTQGGDVATADWGTTTRKGNRLYVHVLDPEATEITLPVKGKVTAAVAFDGRTPVKYTRNKDKSVTLSLTPVPSVPDRIVELTTK